ETSSKEDAWRDVRVRDIRRRGTSRLGDFGDHRLFRQRRAAGVSRSWLRNRWQNSRRTWFRSDRDRAVSLDPRDSAGESTMKRRWNWPIWVAFVVVVAGLFSYEFFARFPITRDFPWANFLLFGVGTALLIAGLFRAFGRPQVYRGKIFGSIFAVIAVLIVTLFSYEIFYALRQVPASAGAPRVGQKAPDFLLLDQNGKPVGLGDLVSNSKGVVLIFYRGFGDCYATPSCGVSSKGCRSSRD